MKPTLSKDFIDIARNYWEEECLPLLREPNDGDRILVFTWAPNLEHYTLLDADINFENYDEFMDSASIATNLISELLPSEILSDEELVFSLDTGFFDINGNYTEQLSIEEPWHVTLIQKILDDQNVDICIVAPDKYIKSLLIIEHINKAKYSIDVDGKYAAFRHYEIKRKIAEFVRNYFNHHKTLPIGNFTVNQIDVHFNS